MELNTSNINNFWNHHALNDFEPIAFLKNVHSSELTSVCFLKDGRLAISLSYEIGIFNKITFQKEMRIL